MCDPVSAGLALGGAALTAGGSYINAKQQNANAEAFLQAEQDREAAAALAREEERQNQRDFTRQQFADVDETTKKLDPGARAEAVEATVADPINRFKLAAKPYTDLPDQVEDASGEVIGPGGRAAKGAERTRRMIEGLATLTAQGTAGLGARNDILGLGDRLSLIGSKAAGSAAVGARSQQVPTATVIPEENLFGDLLVGTGSALSGYGGNQIGLAGGDPFKINVGKLRLGP